MTAFDAPAIVFPDGLDPEAFLGEYWQKKPLVMTAAMPGWVNPLDANELAWLSGQDDVESRIVETRNGEYVLRHGPFGADDFSGMGKTDWTLLVQDVDKHLPDLAAILDRFDFLPSWRLDDLMISFAAPGGSVGPHVDAYDVFLLQAHGTRIWHLGRPGEELDRVADAELDLLSGFEPDWSVTLGPGDMLYLPPGVPHHGVAADETLTWSIGFRAPSVADMVTDFSGFVAGEIGDVPRYVDPDLQLDEAELGALSERAVQRVRTLLDGALSRDDDTLRRWLGCLLTEGKPWLAAAPPEDASDAAPLADRLSAGGVLHRHPMTRWTHARGAGHHFLFVDGRCEKLPQSLADLAALICTRRHVQGEDLAIWLKRPAARALLIRLIADGKLYFSVAGKHPD